MRTKKSNETEKEIELSREKAPSQRPKAGDAVHHYARSLRRTQKRKREIMKTILFIHGIGNQRFEDWQNSMEKHMLEKATGMAVVPFWWADILGKSLSGKVANAVGRGASSAHPVLKAFAPVLEVFSDRIGDVTTYEKVRQNAYARLLKTLDSLDCEPSDVLIVSHSMGTVLATEFLWLAKRMNFDCFKKVNAHIMLGSPLDSLPVRGRTFKRLDDYLTFKNGVALFPAPVRHINIYGQHDRVCAVLWGRDMQHWNPDRQLEVHRHGHDLFGYIEFLCQEFSAIRPLFEPIRVNHEF